MGPLRLDSASVARKMSDVIRPLHNFAPFVRPFSGILSVIGILRQLSEVKRGALHAVLCHLASELQFDRELCGALVKQNAADK